MRAGKTSTDTQSDVRMDLPGCRCNTTIPSGNQDEGHDQSDEDDDQNADQDAGDAGVAALGGKPRGGFGAELGVKAHDVN